MTLMEQIKVKQVQARKSGSIEASLLTTLLGEAAMVGKNAGRETNDAEVVAVVKKFVKNIDETVSALTSRGQDAATFVAERDVLEQFLPVQLSENALIEVRDLKNLNDILSDFIKVIVNRVALFRRNL
jgi:uncharacterized protein YqeY